MDYGYNKMDSRTQRVSMRIKKLFKKKYSLKIQQFLIQNLAKLP